MPQNPNWYVAAKQYPAVTGLIVLSAIGGMLVTLSYPTAVLGWGSRLGVETIDD